MLARAALGFGGEHHDVADLVLVGLFTGSWQALGDAVIRGLSLDAARAEEMSAEELERAVAAFRYERRLIAAAELREWLSQRLLSLGDLHGVMRRRLLSKRFEGVPCAGSAGPTEVAAVIRAEAICAGTLAGCARELSAWHAGCDALESLGIESSAAARATDVEDLLAAALADAPSGLPTLGPVELRDRAARLVTLAVGYESFREGAVPEAAIARRLEERRMDWTVVTGSELGFQAEGAALETRLRVLHDGQTLAQVAELLSLEPARREFELGGAPEKLAAELLAARAGDLVGPWSERERWRVLELHGRAEPGLADRRARERAREQLLGELVERFSAGKVRELAAL